MNDHPNRFLTGSDPAETEIETMLRNYYKEDLGEYPDFSKMAERAMVNSDVQPIKTMKKKPWHVLAKRGLLAAAAFMMVLGLLKLSFYAVPRWQQFAYAAFQSFPFAEYLISDQDIGLLREAEKGNIQIQQLSDTVDDFRIDITGTYADSNRTIIFFQVFPPKDSPADQSAGWMPTHIELVDQFGMSHGKNYSVVMNSEDNKGMMEFPAVPSWLSALGVRFQLEIGTLDWTTVEESIEKNGPWTMSWVQEWRDVVQTIDSEASSVTPKGTIKLKKVTLAPSSTKLDFTAEFQKSLSFDSSSGDDVDAEQSTGNDSKPLGDEMYIEKVADGTRYDFLSSGFSTSGFDRVGKGDIIFQPLEEPGEYRFVIKRIQNVDGEWILPFTVPDKR